MCLVVVQPVYQACWHLMRQQDDVELAVVDREYEMLGRVLWVDDIPAEAEVE